MNNTAVVIGAMLVAPLMTPILGLALSLVRSDQELSRIALRSDFRSRQSHHLKQLVIQHGTNDLRVRADVEAPDIVGPATVATLEEQLTILTGQSTRLHVRTTVTHEVSATGSIDKTLQKSLNGFQEALPANTESFRLVDAEQLIREYLENKFQIRLARLQALSYDRVDII